MLSDNDILKHFHNIKMMPYSEIHKYRSLDDLFDNNINKVLVLYINKIKGKLNEGHWVGLMKYNDNTIEFFDPLGLNIDKELEWYNKQHKRKTKQDKNYLVKLFYEHLKNGYKGEYNEMKMQEQNEITCGYHVYLRFLLFDNGIKLKEYQELMKLLKSKINLDDFVKLIY